MVSQASNYAILFAAPLGPEAVGGAVVLGDAADLTSFVSKGLGSGLIYNNWNPMIAQGAKAFANTITLRAIAVEQANAQVAKNPFLRAEISTALNAIYH